MYHTLIGQRAVLRSCGACKLISCFLQAAGSGRMCPARRGKERWCCASMLGLSTWQLAPCAAILLHAQHYVKAHACSYLAKHIPFEYVQPAVWRRRCTGCAGYSKIRVPACWLTVPPEGYNQAVSVSGCLRAGLKRLALACSGVRLKLSRI